MEGRDTGDEEHHVFSAVCSSRPDMLGTGTQGGAPEKGVSKQRLEAQERGGGRVQAQGPLRINSSTPQRTPWARSCSTHRPRSGTQGDTRPCPLSLMTPAGGKEGGCVSPDWEGGEQGRDMLK